MTVSTAKWWRRHPVLVSVVALIGVVMLTFTAVVAIQLLTAPELDCGPGMVANTSSSACIGVNLASGRISSDQPDRLSTLLADVKASNDAVSGTNYVSIVLLLNFSPIKNVDTFSYENAYYSIEGAITAVWQANHTAVFSGSSVLGEEPKVKLFLANMGSKNADWEKAVDQIAINAKANRITSVVGLGQSTDNTRWAATKMSAIHRIPVIGATVTADSMNFDMRDNTTLLSGFFRVAPTNSDTVSASARYVIEGLQVPLDKVAIVEDTVTSDDYVTTLVQAAHTYLDTPHRFPFTSPDINTDIQARDEWLRSQFGYLDINLCAAEPKVVYFAGRGADIGVFVKTWIESGTDCSNRPLLLLTGDDGNEAVWNDHVANAVGDSRAQIMVRYTGLASPGTWGDCPASSDTAAKRDAYDRFQAAFTGQPSCGIDVSPTGNGARLAYPVEDLDNGQAILTHDSVGLAAVTARRTGPSALTDPMSQIGVLQQTRCRTVFRGASGIIQFSADRGHYGNPIGAILPIQDITKDKRSVTIPPGWSTGGPSPTEGC